MHGRCPGHAVGGAFDQIIKTQAGIDAVFKTL